MDNDVKSGGGRLRRARWLIIGFLLIIAAINYADRAAMGVAAKPIMHDLGLSAAGFGLLGALSVSDTLHLG